MSLFIPSTKIITTGGSTGNAQKISLASREWFELQNRVQAVLNLPSEIASFNLRYGDSSSGLEMKECFDAMRRLRSVTANYGNPKQLRAKILADPNLLAGDYMPKNDVYTALMWTIQLAHRDTANLVSALRSIPVIARGESPSDIVAGIKGTFMDTNQILDKMVQTVEAFKGVISAIESLEHELEESQTAMTTYTSRSSKTRIALDTEIGNLASEITKLEKDREDAYEKWLNLTVSACAAAAGIAILGIAITLILAPETAGASLAFGTMITAAAAGAAGTGLGIAASIARSDYDNILDKLSTQNELQKKRTAYRHDLGALDDSMKFTLPASNGVVNQLKDMQSGWNSLIGEIKFKVGDLTTDNLETGPWLKPDEMNSSAQPWANVDEALRAFSLNSFLDYELLDFGAALPKDDSENWLKKVVASAAA